MTLSLPASILTGLRALLVCLLCAPLPAWALELVMVEQAICPYCKMFDEQVGATYAETDIGARVPLRRVDLKSDWPQDLASVARDRLTPTFILVSDGAEVGRLRGYPGEEEFWRLLKQLIKQHDNG
jgi:thioredoxin-related protein